MTTVSLQIPTAPQWRLVNLVAARQAFTAERRASRMLDRAEARPSDLGDLAARGWLAGHHEGGGEVDLVNDWNHSLARVHLRLTGTGLDWLASGPNAFLAGVADRVGPRAMKPAEVAEHDELLMALIGRSLLIGETERGRALRDSILPSRQARGEPIYVRLTRSGERIINP